MKRKKLPKILSLLFLLLILITIGSTLAGSNTMPDTNVKEYTGAAITPEDHKPAECNPIYVDEITAGSGVINGTRSNNLILGSRWLTNCIVGGGENDYIDGSKKAEIILGNPGNDTILNRPSDDVIYGGPGDDYIDSGKDYDICYEGGGNDTFVRYEEIY